MLVDRPRLRKLTDVDRIVFDRLVDEEHPLRLALEHIPWEETFKPLVESYYCPDMGQPAIEPLIMLKLEFLRYRHNLSDRQVIDRATTDFAFRYFLGISYLRRLPDPSLLCRFRGRLGTEGFKQIFEKLVGFAREEGIVKDRLRLKDASHVIANIAIPSTLKLVAQARDRLLAAAEPWDPETAAGHSINIELLRERTEDLPPDERLEARVIHLQEMLEWAEQIQSPQDAETNKYWQQLQKQCEVTRKILYDRENPDEGRRTLSVVDPDARRGKHGEWFDGFKVDITMDPDSGIITNVCTEEAGADEAKNAVEMIDEEQQAHGNQIEGLSMDGAGFNGEMLHELEDRKITVYTPPRQEPETGKFTPDDFKQSEDGSHVTCPAGKQSKYRERDKDKHGVKYRFARNDCAGCLLAAACLHHKVGKATIGRTVNKNDNAEEYARARERAKTAEYAEVRKQHPAVERKLNEVLNHHRGRRARYWGLPKTQAQECMVCFTVNVKRILKLLMSGSSAQNMRPAGAVA